MILLLQMTVKWDMCTFSIFAPKNIVSNAFYSLCI